MKNKLIVTVLAIVTLVVSGCANFTGGGNDEIDIDSYQKEKLN